MLGPSGSGKTTTLMMLAGFETATHGEIFLKGTPINNTPPNKRGIGMVFQNYALFPHMTVNENLAFPLRSARHGQGDDRSQGRTCARHGVAIAVRRAQAGAAIRWSAAARRGGARARVRAGHRADGRTPGRTRQATARADAVRDQDPDALAWGHDGVRHARSGRGSDDVGPDRGVQRRRDPAAVDAGRTLRGADQLVRRPVHRREQPVGWQV